jgi:hypothetical protein
MIPVKPRDRPTCRLPNYDEIIKQATGTNLIHKPLGQLSVFERESKPILCYVIHGVHQILALGEALP